LRQILSDAVMIFTGLYAAPTIRTSCKAPIPQGIVTLVLGCAVLAGFLFLDWRALLHERSSPSISESGNEGSATPPCNGITLALLFGCNERRN